MLNCLVQRLSTDTGHLQNLNRALPLARNSRDSKSHSITGSFSSLVLMTMDRSSGNKRLSDAGNNSVSKHSAKSAIPSHQGLSACCHCHRLHAWCFCVYCPTQCCSKVCQAGHFAYTCESDACFCLLAIRHVVTNVTFPCMTDRMSMSLDCGATWSQLAVLHSSQMTQRQAWMLILQVRKLLKHWSALMASTCSRCATSLWVSASHVNKHIVCIHK